MSTGEERGAGGPSDSTHRGAAFGIPAGATGPDVVDAVFGAQALDPELLPYFEAADAPAEVSLADLHRAELEADEAERARAEEDRQALRELVAHGLIGARGVEDLDALLAEIDEDASDDWEDWEPVLPDTPASGRDDAPDEEEAHRADLRAAARAVDVSARLRAIEAEILSRAPEHRIQPSLERVEMALDILGNPERTYRVIHVTGTNGKTSTARMIERLLAATGMRTGRFTSPHLDTIRERITLDGEAISPEGFIAAWEDVAPYIHMVDATSQDEGGPRMSFFEVLTVMALAAFADHPVDVAIVEVGLGGTWDSTNVVRSDVEVITPIGRDHGMWLGETLEEIAANKAGIIKDGATLITAAQPAAAQAVIAEKAAEHAVVWRREADPHEDPQAPGAGQLRVVDRVLAVGGQMVTLATAAAVYEGVFIPLHGQYQAHNALLALAAAEAVFGGKALPARIVEHGFAAVTSPGRLEVLRSSPTVLLDAAHNPHGMEALVPAVEETFGLRHLVAVLGVMADKDAEGILSVLEPAVEAVVCVPIDSPRAMDPEDLAEVAREVFGSDRVEVAETLIGGVERAVTLAESFDAPMTSTGVLIVGSVLLAAEARALMGRA